MFEPAPLSHPKGSLLCVKLAGASASAWGFGVCVADDLASDKKVLCVLANFDREDCLVSIPGDVKETFRDDAILIKKSRVLRTCRKDDEYSVLDKETMDIKVNEDLVVATDAMMTSMLRAARQRRRTNHAPEHRGAHETERAHRSAFGWGAVVERFFARSESRRQGRRQGSVKKEIIGTSTAL